MVAEIAEFEYITCQSEMEALILECNLIKKYAPKYNVLLRDDKTYPYIKVTMGEDFPRVVKTRRVKTVSYTHLDVYKRQVYANVGIAQPSIFNTLQIIVLA